jgi:aspartyl-tRNA(Asn)/glutamyl-tRNA(Gln) amidotransferase subunit B
MRTAEKYDSVIGLETHAQLKTESKLFCGCSAEFGAPPNSRTCPVCLGMPGILPVLNEKAVEHAVKMAQAVNARIRSKSVFARKNYFYPDLPKGYQISQYDFPIAEGGGLEIDFDGLKKIVEIKRIHIEEDAGKSLHPEVDDIDYTLVDYNRCGIPLIEIVTGPIVGPPEIAVAFLTRLRQLLIYIDISNADLEKGEFRCDVNISLRPEGQIELGERTEIKNLNSFKAVRKALDFEIERQARILESGNEVVRQTLLWDEKTERCEVMRSKEEEDDYRYFPEPDLMILEIPQELSDRIKGEIPELPYIKKDRFIRQYGLSSYAADLICENKDIAEYYEKVVGFNVDSTVAANWIMGEVFRELKERGHPIGDFKIGAPNFAELLRMVETGEITASIAKEVFSIMAETGRDAESIVDEKGLRQITDPAVIEKAVQTVLDENEEALHGYLKGKEKLYGFFVGQVMKKTGGKADPRIVNRVMREQLSKKRNNIK